MVVMMNVGEGDVREEGGGDAGLRRMQVNRRADHLRNTSHRSQIPPRSLPKSHTRSHTRSLPDPGSHLLVGFDKKDEANAGGKQKDDIVVRAGEVGSEGRQAGGAVCVEEDEQLGGRLGRKLAGD